MEEEKNISQNDDFWDPVDSNIKLGRFKKPRQAMKEKFKELQKSPRKLKLTYWSLVFLGIFVWGGMGYWSYRDSSSSMTFLFGGEDTDGLFWVLLLAWVPLFGFMSYVKNLQVDLIKERIAEKRKWVYNPAESSRHWQSLKTKFPSIFAKGNKNQNVQDEIWGKYKNDDQDIDFYSGIFEYSKESGSNKKKHTTRYFQTFFGIRLNEKLNKDLILTPNGKIKKVFKALLSEKISLESVEFNEIFSIEYGGKTEEKLDIFKMLSPAVQLELIRLGKESRDLKILFSGSTFLFIQNGFLFQKEKMNFIFRFFIGMIPFAKQVFIRKMNSDFIKKVEISPKDEAFFEKKITNLLNIATEIPQYLD